MLQVTFGQKDGKVQVFAMHDAGAGSDVVSVTTNANRLPDMLPTETAEALRDAVAELHETLSAAMPRTLKIVQAKAV